MSERVFQVVDADADDPQWYKDAIIYQVHVRSFKDDDADGIGDFKGLTAQLDYIQDLGVTAIWVLPFYPSPLRDDGYDIADYNRINPSYGTMRDVRRFIREAHARGLKVISELVANHTSDQHAWFQRARRAKPGSVYRDFYVWSDTADKYSETRIIFKDFETSNWTWDPVADAYYFHRFYHHQPDLNFDNPRVHDAIIKAMDFWFDAGIDGLRLDAIPYLYEREGTNCENLPETHEFLKKLRAHVDEKYENRMLLAEANQWPEDSVEYFGQGKGDECHMAFHFPVMPRLYMAVRMEDHYPIIDIMEQTPEIPETSQWAMFLRNHDELTLEMVTDEERDYMYRTYAHDQDARINLGIRRRLSPLMNNNRRRIELMNGLLFSMPGTPVIYYGDEIGMGDNIYLGDRNGVRTPMQWTADRNAGFSDANRQKLYSPIIVDPEYHYETVNVETQQRNPQSLLWWMKRMINLRKRYKAFGRGTLEFLPVDNRKILAFIREYENEKILVIANLSRFSQAAELDLSDYQQMVPVEMFGEPASRRSASFPISRPLACTASTGSRSNRRKSPATMSQRCREGSPGAQPDRSGRLGRRCSSRAESAGCSRHSNRTSRYAAGSAAGAHHPGNGYRSDHTGSAREPDDPDRDAPYLLHRGEERTYLPATGLRHRRARRTGKGLDPACRRCRSDGQLEKRVLYDGIWEQDFIRTA
ncbi:MAG: maltose alpha-D-glucosyltransferase [Thermomicrobiales bacterium]